MIRVSVAVARGMLDVRVDVPMHPLARIEALRLLARATVEADEAWAALVQAEQEAAKAGYPFVQALALGDALRQCGAAEGDGCALMVGSSGASDDALPICCERAFARVRRNEHV